MSGHISSLTTNSQPLGVVIDGRTLMYALEDPLNAKFLDLARRCQVVLCCRATPSQKVSLKTVLAVIKSDVDLTSYLFFRSWLSVINCSSTLQPIRSFGLNVNDNLRPHRLLFRTKNYDGGTFARLPFGTILPSLFIILNFCNFLTKFLDAPPAFCYLSPYFRRRSCYEDE